MEKAFNQKCHLEVYIHFLLLPEMQRNHSEEREKDVAKETKKRDGKMSSGERWKQLRQQLSQVWLHFPTLSFMKH